MAVLYEAAATATGGRGGRVRTPDDALSAELAIPKELGGPGGLATNPEQLFAAGYAACFESAIRFAARGEKIPVNDSSVTARVGIGPNESGGFELTVELRARLPAVGRETAERLVARAHEICPYSNATRGNIDVQIVVDAD
jgi:Ohr subfamily peroxiredoxin